MNNKYILTKDITLFGRRYIGKGSIIELLYSEIDPFGEITYRFLYSDGVTPQELYLYTEDMLNIVPYTELAKAIFK